LNTHWSSVAQRQITSGRSEQPSMKINFQRWQSLTRAPLNYKGIYLKQDKFIENFTNIIQPNINDIKKIIDNTDNKLSTLNFTLLIIVLGTLFLTNHFDLHIMFFIMTLLISAIIYHTGTYTFKYEYHDILERDIFPKILKISIEESNFFTNKDLYDDAENSDIFSTYEYIVASATIKSIWNIKYIYKQKQIYISSTYINVSEVHNLGSPFSDKNHGLFITIDNINLLNLEVYIFENNLLPSIKEISKKLKKDFIQDNTHNDKYTVISKNLDTQSKDKIYQILNLFNQDMTMTLKNNKIYIFIKKEFTCFDANYYTDGRIPSYFDYIELLNIKSIIEEVIELTEEV